jgi:predicted DNA-binding protein (MmcQ/YjbR family)
MYIDTIRDICASFPAVTEDIKWEHHLVFSVGEKMFCMTTLEPPFSCSFKVSDEEFEEMSQREGLSPAPYMARAKWILAQKPLALTKSEWKSYLKKSYDLVKARLTKKLRGELGI